MTDDEAATLLGIAPMRATFRIIDTQFGTAVVRTAMAGNELVWEFCRSKRHAVVRRTYHQHLEDLAAERCAAHG